MIGGSEHDWPFNWFDRFLAGRRLPRALSIGCGTGALERDLIVRGWSDRVDAFDGSIASLSVARREAESAGFGKQIRYFAADFNEPSLPRALYDAVFFHHSLHHVAKLEKLLRAVMHALKPDGLLYLDEYVGPSRAWWTDERFKRERELFRRVVPPEYRFVDEIPLPIVYPDPSEAVRSGEILQQLRVGFDLLENRVYGGNFLSVSYAAVNWAIAPPDLLDRLIEAERELLRSGEPHFLAVLVAKPKRGVGKRIASGRYFLEPKLKRVGRDLRAALR